MIASQPVAGEDLPKLKIKVFGQVGEDICELDQAGYLFSFTDRMVMIDGKRVNSYDELLGIAGRKAYRHRQYIEVNFLPHIVGG